MADRGDGAAAVRDQAPAKQQEPAGHATAPKLTLAAAPSSWGSIYNAATEDKRLQALL